MANISFTRFRLIQACQLGGMNTLQLSPLILVGLVQQCQYNFCICTSYKPDRLAVLRPCKEYRAARPIHDSGSWNFTSLTAEKSRSPYPSSTPGAYQAQTAT